MITSHPLSERQLKEFLELGFTRLDDAFSVSTAKQCLSEIRQRLIASKDPPIDLEDPTTFPSNTDSVAIGSLQELLPASREPWKSVLSPRLLAALNQILGDPSDWIKPDSVGWFPISYPDLTTSTWRWRSLRGRWHVDGEFARRLDTPNQALLLLFLFTDVEERSSGTAVIEGSHKMVARKLYESEPNYVESRQIKDWVRKEFRDEILDDPESHVQVRDAWGKAGSVWICHPLLVHASSFNVGKAPRVIANIPIVFKNPMRVLNEDVSDSELSLVELSMRESIGISYT